MSNSKISTIIINRPGLFAKFADTYAFATSGKWNVRMFEDGIDIKLIDLTTTPCTFNIVFDCENSKLTIPRTVSIVSVDIGDFHFKSTKDTIISPSGTILIE